MPTVYLKDYQASAYSIEHINLDLELDAENTRVTATLALKSNNCPIGAPLILNGGDCELESIDLNSKRLTSSDFTVDEGQLTLNCITDEAFVLTIITKINPKENTALAGLYETEGILTTQCESEGFRNITYFLDRPDILATYKTRISADKVKYPVLLSNGNLISSGLCEKNPTRHFAVYEDPIPKPSYLFALVAGNLALRNDSFITRSGKNVSLNIYVPNDDLPKTKHAMNALKDAMRFDEDHYDREYDLERYNIVGVPQFNAGAMENKGLNIFNNGYLLAHPEITTDDAYEEIYSTVGHEYFHNWRGNRITVKNWFQLSLKEGFATITEQEFAQSLFRSMVPRIEDIDALQQSQFAQDSGPLAHAVLPVEYDDTDNLYTTTIYLKGAELLNMLKTLLGKDLFKQGCSIYFAVNDGKAANIEDFLAAMEQASGRDLSQFLLWYQQAGTPELQCTEYFDEATQTYQLMMKQSCSPTPGQPQKSPLLIPIALGLFDVHGQEIPLQLQGEKEPQGTTRLLELKESTQTFTFIGIKNKPILSLLRQFSAPVRITKSPVTAEDRKFLLKYETDPVNRWLVAQNIAQQTILNIILDLQANRNPSIDVTIFDIYREILTDATIEPRLKSKLLTAPSLESFFELLTPADPGLIYQAQELFITHFIEACYSELLTTYLDMASKPISSDYNPEDAGVRCLKNFCLFYLVKANTKEGNTYCLNQLHQATNMTDTLGALGPLAILHHPDRANDRQEALADFSQKWAHDALTIEHLFELYALSEAPNALEQVIAMTQSSLFNKENPNHISALINTFCRHNPEHFHDIEGKAYRFLADYIIEIDKINPSSSCYLVRAFANWKKLEPKRQEKMLEQLFRLHALTDLSSSVRELVDKSIQEALENIANPEKQQTKEPTLKKKEQKKFQLTIECAELDAGYLSSPEKTVRTLKTFFSEQVTAHPLPTSRGLTAGSKDLSTSLDPVVKPRGVLIISADEHLPEPIRTPDELKPGENDQEKDSEDYLLPSNHF